MNNLSLSTSWNSWRHKDGREMVGEILDLGFRRIELSHGIHSPLLEGVLKAREKHDFAISSVHNFLPMPVEVLSDSPDCYEFTSHRPHDRERAVALTRQTIDWAARLGAPVVVVHCGLIRSLNLTAPLRDIVGEGGIFGRPFVRKKLAAVQRRERVAALYLQRVLDCLTDLADHAGAKGVKLGIENREDYEAVPGERELADFLRRLDSAHAGYWHDFGHAQIKHNLGLLDHAQWLRTAAPLAIGCHIHDVKWPFRDHCAPFTGEIDFANLIPLLPPTCQFVFELSPRTGVEEIRASATRWHDLFPA